MGEPFLFTHMSHYSKLPPDQKAKVDAYLTAIENQLADAIKQPIFSSRTTQAFQKFMNDMCRKFEVKKERLAGSGEPGHFILRIHKKTENPCNEIPIAPWGKGWMNRPTLREEETQAILSIVDQLDAAQEQIKKLEVDVQRWKDEAERWRKIQLREYFSQDSE
jgi:hypothetical protein